MHSPTSPADPQHPPENGQPASEAVTPAAPSNSLARRVGEYLLKLAAAIAAQSERL